MSELQTIIAWLQAHPTETLTLLMAAWGLLNALWAQLPKPASPVLQKVWTLIHDVLLLVTTHSTQPGTLTWPSVLRIFLGGPDPFGEVKAGEKPPQDPPLPPATVG
jgi:hypothetical protein